MYVYVIRSLKYSSRTYVGCTNNLKKRWLLEHNSGNLRTPPNMDYGILKMVRFGLKDAAKAFKFERYVKSHSGH